MNARTAPFLLVLLAAACAAGPDPAGAPGPSRNAAPVDPLAPPWTFSTSQALRTQRLILTARLVTEMDTLVREDSVQSTLEVAWSAQPDRAPVRYAGSVTDFRVRVNADTALAPEGVAFPLAFVAEAAGVGSQPRFVTPAPSPCGAPAADLVQGWRELWVSPPASLRPGDAWQDSSAYALCRDGIPLWVTSVRSYVAEAAVSHDSVVHVVVVRRSRVMLEGSGLQFGDTVRIIGGGSSTARLLLPLSGGAMTGDGEGVLTLELRGRRRTQRLTQEHRLEILAP